MTALTAAESAQYGALSSEGHGGRLWVRSNSHLWAGAAVDGERVGGEERGSLGSAVRLPVCFVNKAL